jgi:translation initiation factor IF-2
VRETFIGYAEILEVFNITKVGKVAGCRSPKAGRARRGVSACCATTSSSTKAR